MKKTNCYKWYHKILRIWCYFWGHNTFAGFEYEKTKFRTFDYCRRCEGIIGEPGWWASKKTPVIKHWH